MATTDTSAPKPEARPVVDSVLRRARGATFVAFGAQGFSFAVLTSEVANIQSRLGIDDGTLSEAQIERLGQTFMALADRMEELRQEFGLDADDLNLNLGPLGNLL